MRTLVSAVVFIIVFVAGCSSGVPVSAVSDIQLKPASSTPTEGMTGLPLYGTDRIIYVATEPILRNSGMARVERTHDENGNDAIVLHFTSDGSKLISEYTKSQRDSMIALLIDENLMLALPIQSEISGSAMISGGMSRNEVSRLFAMLTATEVRNTKTP